MVPVLQLGPLPVSTALWRAQSTDAGRALTIPPLAWLISPGKQPCLWHTRPPRMSRCSADPALHRWACTTPSSVREGRVRLPLARSSFSFTAGVSWAFWHIAVHGCYIVLSCESYLEELNSQGNTVPPSYSGDSWLSFCWVFDIHTWVKNLLLLAKYYEENGLGEGT